MSAVDTGDAIRAINAQSTGSPECPMGCWCRQENPTARTHSRMHWMPGDPIVRFPLEEEK